jgi:hypothetical protein
VNQYRDYAKNPPLNIDLHRYNELAFSVDPPSQQRPKLSVKYSVGVRREYIRHRQKQFFVFGSNPERHRRFGRASMCLSTNSMYAIARITSLRGQAKLKVRWPPITR